MVYFDAFVNTLTICVSPNMSNSSLRLSIALASVKGVTENVLTKAVERADSPTNSNQAEGGGSPMVMISSRKGDVKRRTMTVKPGDVTQELIDFLIEKDKENKQKIPKSLTEDLSRAFLLLDTDGDGVLSAQNMSQILECLGGTYSQNRTTFRTLLTTAYQAFLFFH